MPVDACMEGAVHEIFRAYRRTLQADRRHLLEQYRIVDIARKVVGVGSVGTRCWALLLMGRKDTDPVFLPIKEIAYADQNYSAFLGAVKTGLLPAETGSRRADARAVSTARASRRFLPKFPHGQRAAPFG